MAYLNPSQDKEKAMPTSLKRKSDHLKNNKKRQMGEEPVITIRKKFSTL